MTAPAAVPDTARAVALDALRAMERNGAWADAALKARLDKAGLSRQDAALASRLVYGVTQNRLLLDFWLSSWCSQSLEHLQPPLREILRLGAYQIVFLDKVPDSAAVNESVELAKRSGRGAASGLVNAVLRQVVRNKDNLPKPEERDEVKFLSLTYSHPKWLVKRLLALLGREGAESFLRADNSVPPVTVQVNPLRSTVESLTEELAALGVTAELHPWAPGCLLLSDTGDIAALPPFREGKFLVQDGAARAVTLAASPKPGDFVLDVCAAPGGKSFSAAMAMGDQGRVLACDLHENKLKRVREGAGRLGLTCVGTEAADARQFRPEWADSADVVLVDAPCSGLGIIRKKPDARYKRPDDLMALPVLQSAILDSAARYVKPGGTLVYSTCTILPEENEEVTDVFLAERPDFVREGFALPGPAGETEGQITLWPHLHGTDGFYMSRLIRKK